MSQHPDLISVKRALISVSDKSGIVDFARALTGFGVEILSTGGTYKLLHDSESQTRIVVFAGRSASSGMKSKCA